MKRRKGKLVFFLLASLGAGMILSCAGGLPPSLERDIRAENDKLLSARQDVQRSQEKVRQELAQAPDLFAGAPEPAAWTASFSSARATLDSAQTDAKELDRLTHTRGREVEGRARRLLQHERGLREAALNTSKTVESNAGKWLAFRHDLAASLDGMQREYQTIRSVDLTPAATTITRTEQDWPAKASDLDNRLAALRAIPKKAEGEWEATKAARQDAAAGKASGQQVATLIETDDLLSQQAKTLAAGPDELRGLCNQLYDAWDKILTDLDESHYGEDTLYRERLKTVRTHFIDVAKKQTETHSDEHWTNVSEASFHAVQNDLGMAIAHKDAGHFDSEAEGTPQPPGYAYVASPEQGSNQYGYWSHNGGESIWTFLPQYLLLRELLWNHDYRPVAVGEYGAYRTAQRSGTSYYGQQTPNSPPKYGSHGTFTETHYANSRYVQSGGFKGSAYASRGGPGVGFGNGHAESPGASGLGNDSAGKRFGRQPGSAPQGQRFGRPGGFRPSGRGFGRRR
jgi:hypothetical protein